MIYRALIVAAAGMWYGCDDREFAANPEYLKGQVELICTAMDMVTDDYRESVEADIRREVAG